MGDVSSFSNFDDYPAAHSMDSGWFAIDREGVLAHFDTGEAGALMITSPCLTGESDRNGASEALYLDYIAPWLARNVPAQEFAIRRLELRAYFETGDAARLCARECDAVTLIPGSADVLKLVEDSETLRERLAATPGFLGLAPSSLYELMYEVEHLTTPLAFYRHGDWSTPGHYVRTQAPAPGAQLELRVALPQLDVVFAQANEIHLADIAEEYDFESWGGASLSGEPLPREVVTPPHEVLWTWLAGIFKEKERP